MALLYYVHVILVASHGTIEEKRLLSPSVRFTALFALDSRMAVVIRWQVFRIWHAPLERLSFPRIQVIG